MSDEGDNNFVSFIYRGVEGEYIIHFPDNATHVFVHEDVTVVLRNAFCQHPNIVEVICHDKVEKIEEMAFCQCPSLRRVIMPGVKIVEREAFCDCDVLTDVECGKLEIIGENAFGWSNLRSINLPSATIVEEGVFCCCTALTDVKFGNKLERIDEGTFSNCDSLERITIPLKDGLIDADDAFRRCENLKHVDLIEGDLHETIAALHLKEWRNDMNEEIFSIDRILPDTPAGNGIFEDGEKARAIRGWIRTVLRKIVHYQAEHQRIMDVAADTLEVAVPRDIMMNNVLPFLDLPLHTVE